MVKVKGSPGPTDARRELKDVLANNQRVDGSDEDTLGTVNLEGQEGGAREEVSTCNIQKVGTSLTRGGGHYLGVQAEAPLEGKYGFVGLLTCT